MWINMYVSYQCMRYDYAWPLCPPSFQYITQILHILAIMCVFSLGHKNQILFLSILLALNSDNRKHSVEHKRRIYCYFAGGNCGYRALIENRPLNDGLVIWCVAAVVVGWMLQRNAIKNRITILRQVASVSICVCVSEWSGLVVVSMHDCNTHTPIDPYKVVQLAHRYGEWENSFINFWN